MRQPAKGVAKWMWVARRTCALCPMAFVDGLLRWHGWDGFSEGRWNSKAIPIVNKLVQMPQGPVPTIASYLSRLPSPLVSYIFDRARDIAFLCLLCLLWLTPSCIFGQARGPVPTIAIASHLSRLPLYLRTGTGACPYDCDCVTPLPSPLVSSDKHRGLSLRLRLRHTSPVSRLPSPHLP